MNVAVGAWGVATLVLLLVARMPVALALIAVSFGGITFLVGINPAFGIVMNTPYSFVASWTMSAVPMFLLMGFVAYHSGLTTGLFEAAKVVLRKIPGGLAISAVFACSGFAAVSVDRMGQAFVDVVDLAIDVCAVALQAPDDPPGDETHAEQQRKVEHHQQEDADSKRDGVDQKS